ncbi:hypothetical protein ACHAXS_002037 [Conticribra weissflogii]
MTGEKDITIMARGRRSLPQKGQFRIYLTLSVCSRVVGNVAFFAYAYSGYSEPNLLLTKLPRSNNVNDVVVFGDFLGYKLPVVKNIDQMKVLEKRLKNVRDQ